MTVRVTTRAVNAQLQATADLLDFGAGDGASIEIRSGSRPATVDAAATGTLLATLRLARPCGVVSGGVLTLAAAYDVAVVAAGTAAWARWLDADGQVLWDTDVSIAGGAGEVQLTTVSLTVGMLLPLVSATLS